MTAVVTQVPSLVACYADPHKLIPPLGLGAFPCLAFSSAALPNVPKVFNCGAPTQNFLTLIMSSITLPPPASLGGVVSGVFFGACRYGSSSFCVFVCIFGVTRLLDISFVNGYVANAIGIHISPSQFKVWVNS